MKQSCVFQIIFLFIVLCSNGYAEEFRDVRPPVEYPGLNIPLMIGIVFVLTVLGVILFCLLKKRRRKQETVLSHAQIALAKLRGLEQAGLIQNNGYKEFYVRLSEIIRQYIENRFAIKAPEMTTEEFLGHIQTTTQLSDRHKHVLQRFMESADMIKFARMHPEKNMIADDFELLIGFIKETGEE